MAEEVYEFSPYEVSEGLRPPSELTSVERSRELAKINSPNSAYFTSNDDRLRGQIHNRAMALRKAGTIEDQIEHQRGVKQAEKTRETFSDAWDRYERELAERQIQKAQDRIKESLAREGKSIDTEEARNIVDNAQNVFLELEKEGVVDESFRDFLEEVSEDGQEAEGDRLETIQAFHVISGLLSRYRSWAERKGQK